MRIFNVIVAAGSIGAVTGLVVAGSEPPLETVRNVDLSRYAVGGLKSHAIPIASSENATAM